MRVWPGKSHPLGATWDGSGVNFALFAEFATGVELCLFDSPDTKTESSRIPLTERRDMAWHCYGQVNCTLIAFKDLPKRFHSAGSGHRSL